MPPSDMQEAFKKAGINPPANPDHRSHDRSQRHSRGGGGRGEGRGGPPPRLPDDYLRNGYFDDRGYLREELLDKDAEAVARAIGVAYPKMTTHQLRRFFNHAKDVETRLTTGGDFGAINADIKQLKAFARDAVGKNKVPGQFLDFIERNVALVKDEKSFVKGFIEHFQAVVANFSYLFPKQ